ncbi:MAG: succinate dehydrogenase cytochrome b subunit [Herpetosiphon sp.]
MTVYRTTIGKKAIMAITGIILVGFVVFHMLGNMKVYLGPQHFNDYAVGLRAFGGPFLGTEQFLWLARVVLLVAVGLHIMAAVQLTRLSRASRPVAYARKEVTVNYASRTMRWGGVIILLFIVYHILHFTIGAVGYKPGQYVEGDVYHNVVAGFQVWYVSAFYIAAMVALGFHLYHGVWSMFQTLGANNNRTTHALHTLSMVIAGLVVAGNISVPVAVLVGLVR